MLAVVRIGGRIDIKPDIKKTLESLRLTKKNHCVIVMEDEKIIGMLKKCKDYITWGKISPDILRALIAKRGRLIGDKKIPSEKVEEIAIAIENNKKTEIKPVFRLHPPRKGWKNTKQAYPDGDLGQRENIDDIIKRMM
jgi:large subunit ribosomal protein L30